MEDIIIIGAGVTGCAIARELSRDQRKILVLEKGSDVCVGTSKANSGIVHAGHDAKPGTLKAKLNLEGNLMMPQLAKDLDIPFVQNGSLVLCFDESQFETLEELYQQGLINRVKGLKVLDTKELLEMEPNPLAQKDIVTLEDIEPFPYLSFEQGQYNSFYFSEEILSTLVHQKIIKVSDRATLFNLLIGLDGYTISTGIISEELNGKNIIAIPLAVDETIKIGYIVRNDTARSYLGQIFIEALKQNTQELMQGV